MNIRVAGEGDAGALSLLGGATFLETYADRIVGADIVAHCQKRHSVAVYEAWLADQGVRIWLAQTATATPIGYLVLTPATLPNNAADPDDLEVQRIYVLSRFHAAGVGYRLMNAAIEHAAERGARQLVLGVLKKNDRAVSFYRRQGFAEIGTRVFHVGNAAFDDLVLGRSCSLA